MRKLLFLLLTGLLILMSSCRNDFQFEPSTGGLEFSKDTVYLDTVFTNIGSSTYRLKVYNRSDKDISIPKVQLQKGITSKYRIMVDGMTGDAGAQGKIFSNVELLAKDSLFIFIEVTADVASANPTDFLYTDKILFDNIAGAPQDVDLVTLIQDAIFIYPNRTLPTNIKETLILSGSPTTIEGHELGDTELNWINTKPYVVYGYALVPNGKILNIQQGTNVHFHDNSGLIVDKQGTLNILGLLSTYNADGEIIVDREVRFEGDRLEPMFEDVPGQWGTILLLSQNANTITHLTLKNAAIGLYTIPLDIDAFYPTNLTITNSQIYNCSNFGILSIGSNITSKNLVINYCGQASLACTYGGTYNFTHCTFNNNWSSSSQQAVLLNDYYEKPNENVILANNPINVYNFTNCIIYGSNQVEFFAKRLGNYPFNHNLKNCLIKFNAGSNPILSGPLSLFDFTNPAGPYTNSCFIATNSTQFNPKFKSVNNNKLNILINSGAINNGVNLTPNFNDILDRDRPTLPNSNPDIGAYQFVP